MTRTDAIANLTKTGELLVAMLRPLGLSFELYEAFYRAPKDLRQRAVAELLERFGKDTRED